MRYRPGAPLALDGLDLDLPHARRVALVGRSGAGKSTVAAVLLRFCDPVGGIVTLGRAALASYAADDVPTLTGGCLQDPHIGNASIRGNLRLARPGAGDDELAAAGRALGRAMAATAHGSSHLRHSPAKDDDTGTRAQQTAAMAAAR